MPPAFQVEDKELFEFVHRSLNEYATKTWQLRFQNDFDTAKLHQDKWRPYGEGPNNTGDNSKVSKFSRDYMMTALEILYGNCPECGTPQEREVYEEYTKKYRPLMQTSRGKLQTLVQDLHPLPDVKANARRYEPF